jgi:hypothetical protein
MARLTPPADAAVTYPASLTKELIFFSVLVVHTAALPEYTLPAYKSPPMPTPPVICSAPVVVDVLAAVLIIDTAALVVAPRLVIDCSVAVDQTVTAPVLVLTAVSVPATKEVRPLAAEVMYPASLTKELMFLSELVVQTAAPPEYTALAYKLPPIPAPPVICRAPVVVEVLAAVLKELMVPPANMLPPTPIPPWTMIAPVVVDVLCVAVLMVNALMVALLAEKLSAEVVPALDTNLP